MAVATYTVALVAFLSAYLSIKKSIDPQESFVLDKKVLLNEYDFIIVGGGSAGSVVANRLSENPEWTVLLLEAGGEQNDISEIPAIPWVLVNTPMDWSYRTEPPPSKACLIQANGTCHWTAGKSLGGSSAINYMLYVRGNRNDYDTWASLGNYGWSYNNVLPYFKKSEDNRNAEYVKSGYHGTGGYLTVQESPFEIPITDCFIRAAEELRYPVRDINGREQYGFMKVQGTTRNGERCSTNKAFLRSVRSRRNLHVAKKAYVRRVLLDPDTKRVYGVEFERNRYVETVRVKKEVILSAGSIRSPQLLMLSGIGPQEHLNRMGIPIIHDSPGVGQNLQDHLMVQGLIFLTSKPVTLVPRRDLTTNNFLQWLQHRGGIFSTTGAVSVLAFLNSSYSDQSWPDVQLHLCHATVLADPKVAHESLGISEEVWVSTYKDFAERDSWGSIPTLLHPKSVGHLELRSSDPRLPPVIYPNYLSHPDDVSVLVEAIRMSLDLAGTENLKKVDSQLLPRPLKACSHLQYPSDEYWECHVHQASSTIFHYVGTCKMGPAADKMAVVDHKLRVNGVQGLRVVDASVMPKIVSGNTNAPTIMIGEKGSDMIKEAHRTAY